MDHVLPGSRLLALSAEAAHKIVESGDGDTALLYLYILDRNGAFSPDEATAYLKWPRGKVSAAFSRLSAMKLVSGSLPSAPEPEEPKPLPPEPAEELPQYDLEDIRRSSRDGDFSALTTEVQRILGRILSGAELISLFGIYDHISLPPEVILLLVSHCVEESRERFGAGRRVSMRMIEKTAYSWARNELFTLERADKYLSRRLELKAEAKRVLAVLGIRDRKLAPSEERFLASWLEMGYGADEIEAAYDRTALKTGGLNWKYMDSIIKSWNSKGLKTLEDIERRDGATRPGPAKTPDRPEGDDLELLRKQLGMK